MFSTLKNIFARTEQEPGAKSETWGGTKTNEFVSIDGFATIRQMKNGKFRLLVNQNEVLGTYTRRRDAVRGAARRGLTVID